LSAVKFWKSASISGHRRPRNRSSEQRLDALQRPRDRMQATARLAATRQRHVQRLFSQARGQRHLPQRFAARVERCFDGVLGAIDAAPTLLRSSAEAWPSPSARR
jgi:hypothetical protein